MLVSHNRHDDRDTCAPGRLFSLIHNRPSRTIGAEPTSGFIGLTDIFSRWIRESFPLDLFRSSGRRVNPTNVEIRYVERRDLLRRMQGYTDVHGRVLVKYDMQICNFSLSMRTVDKKNRRGKILFTRGGKILRRGKNFQRGCIFRDSKVNGIVFFSTTTYFIVAVHFARSRVENLVVR